jgi:hypothetical protein
MRACLRACVRAGIPRLGTVRGGCVQPGEGGEASHPARSGCQPRQLGRDGSADGGRRAGIVVSAPAPPVRSCTPTLPKPLAPAAVTLPIITFRSSVLQPVRFSCRFPFLSAQSPWLAVAWIPWSWRVMYVWCVIMCVSGGAAPDLRRESGADVDQVNPNSAETAFHSACIYNQPDCAEVLVMRGCDTTLRNRQGHSAQQCASAEGHTAVKTVALSLSLSLSLPFFTSPPPATRGPAATAGHAVAGVA